MASITMVLAMHVRSKYYLWKAKNTIYASQDKSSLKVTEPGGGGEEGYVPKS